MFGILAFVFQGQENGTNNRRGGSTYGGSCSHEDSGYYKVVDWFKRNRQEKDIGGSKV